MTPANMSVQTRASASSSSSFDSQARALSKEGALVVSGAGLPERCRDGT
jgi:hypothetical protein